MKRVLQLLLAFILLISVQNIEATDKFTKEQLAAHKQKYLYKFEHEGENYDVYVAWFDMNDPLLRVDIAMAGDKVGSVANLEKLATSKPDEQVLGAINAAFFNMKEDTQSASSIILNGEVEHIANYGSVMGFDAKNRLIIERPYIKIEGAIDGQWEAPYYWQAENINHLYPVGFDSIMIFNSYYTGAKPENVKSVLVDRNKVIGIYDEFPEIGQNQYVLSAYRPELLKAFRVGQNVEYRSRYFFDEGNKSSDKELAFDNIKNALGVGPTLVKDGKYALADDRERHRLSSFSVRSMIGMTKDGKLAMVVTPKMSFDTLVALALKLGLNDAINLDGGGSSSMIVGDMPIRTTNRKISNAVVVKKVKAPLIRVKLNDLELFFDREPITYKGRTMLPMRKIMEKLGCEVKFDNDTREILVNRYSQELKFKVGSTEVNSNGKLYNMDVPVIIDGDRSFISVRFLTEFLGGVVNWNQDEQMVLLDLPTTQSYYKIALAFNEKQSYDYALNEFLKVLDMNPKHLGALKYSAIIYEKHLSDLRSALDLYEKIYAIMPDDMENLEHLISLYEKLGVKKELLEKYNILLEKRPNDFAYIGLARLYRDLDLDKALEYYKWVIDNSKNEAYRIEAQKFIKSKS